MLASPLRVPYPSNGSFKWHAERSDGSRINWHVENMRTYIKKLFFFDEKMMKMFKTKKHFWKTDHW